MDQYLTAIFYNFNSAINVRRIEHASLLSEKDDTNETLDADDLDIINAGNEMSVDGLDEDD